MAEIHTATTLRRKRDEIVSVIKLYETKLDQAKADLSHAMGLQHPPILIQINGASAPIDYF